MTDDKLIEEAFKTHEGAPTWRDDPVARDAAIRWHMRGFNDALAVFEKAYAPTVDSQFYEGLTAARRAPCIRAVPGSVMPCCGEPTGDEREALARVSEWVDRIEGGAPIKTSLVTVTRMARRSAVLGKIHATIDDGYPDAEGLHALRHPDDWAGADD